MPDVYMTTLEMDSSIPFDRIAEIANTVIKRRSPDQTQIRLLQGYRGDNFYYYQIGLDGGPIVRLWPTKSGGAVLSLSEETGDRVLASNPNVGTARLLVKLWQIRKLNSSMAPFPAFCEALRDAVLEVDPTAGVAIQ